MMVALSVYPQRLLLHNKEKYVKNKNMCLFAYFNSLVVNSAMNLICDQKDFNLIDSMESSQKIDPQNMWIDEIYVV